MAKRLQRKKRIGINKRLLPIAMFLLKFNLLAIPMYIVIFLNLSFEPLQSFIAYVSNGVINLLGYNVTQNGPYMAVIIENQIRQIKISWDSTGWKSLYALFALVISTPVSSYSKKIKFLAIGLPTIFTLNIVRIVTTILVALNFGFVYFDIVHTILWREGLIFAVVGIWFLWLYRQKYNIR